MPNDTISLKVDGSVSLADFRTVVDAFSGLIEALTIETNPDAHIDWIIADLRPGSATIVSRGFFGDNFDAGEVVVIVVEKYERLAKSAEEGRLDDFSDPVRQRMGQLTAVLNGHIPSIKMGTGADRWTATINQRLEVPSPSETTTEDRPKYRNSSRAGIKGKIVMLDDKQATYFTLAEAYTGKQIRCYPGSRWREQIGEYWVTKEYIIVEGTFSRYSTSPVLKNITDIIPLGPGEPGGWRQAVGAAPRNPEGSRESATDVLHRGRDGEE